MLSQWFQQWLWLQWIILPILAIPLAILLGMRWTNGAIIVSSVAAILGVAYEGYQSATDPLALTSGGFSSLATVVGQIGGISQIAALTLALAHAAKARRWWWFALIIIAGYLSYAVSLTSTFMQGVPCAFNPPDTADYLACIRPNQAILLLVGLGKAIGPIVMLIYALRAPGRRQHQLPEGLVISSLHDHQQPEGDNISAD